MAKNEQENVKVVDEYIDSSNCALKLCDISKTYGSGDTAVQALKNINLKFRKNEFVSILGPSGCGKTTLLNIIGGLDRYTSGDLIIDGKSTKDYKDNDWNTYRNNSIGFVFQSYNLIQHQNILSNVELALTLSGVTKQERQEKAKLALKKVGLEGLEHKRPNQLSGGQMQRVAIARALVNDPDIILADEPTGALDSETSVQVMDLLKEVAKDRLVILVTHNPELAKTYSTRIINLLDGNLVDDSNPFKEEIREKKLAKNKGKAHMSFFTALSLSFSNLRTKKGRTVLTSIAGSIGIIGIALVLALSTGFSAFVNKLQADTLSVYPVTIAEYSIDLTDFNKLADATITDEMLNQRVKETVYTKDMFGNLTNMLRSNKLEKEYIDYVEKFVNEKNAEASNDDDAWKYSIQKDYGFDMNNYIYSNISVNMGGNTDATVMPVDLLVSRLETVFSASVGQTGISTSFVRSYIPTMSEIPDNVNLVKSQYDLLKGDWATEENQLLLVVDEYNRISDITLALLGYNSVEKIDPEKTIVEFGELQEFSFESVMAKKFYYINNDNRYFKLASPKTYAEYCYDESNMPEGKYTPLTITGIVRLKDNVSQGILQTGIAYTSKLTEKAIAENKNSVIVQEIDNIDDANIYSFLSTKKALTEALQSVLGEVTITDDLIFNTMQANIAQVAFNTKQNYVALAGKDKASKLSIYSNNYESKEELKTYLNAWNSKPNMSEEDEVHFSDSTEMLFMALNTMVDSIKIVLVCFTSISLIVSSIMIGIITYVSVVERTKEIGILRAIGARKKDISRIFNAETFLIGLFAGLIGVGVSYLLSIPINFIVAKLVENVGNIATLRLVDAGILVACSFILTIFAGIIPSRIAAKKDPVVALRTE